MMIGTEICWASPIRRADGMASAVSSTGSGSRRVGVRLWRSCTLRVCSVASAAQATSLSWRMTEGGWPPSGRGNRLCYLRGPEGIIVALAEQIR